MVYFIKKVAGFLVMTSTFLIINSCICDDDVIKRDVLAEQRILTIYSLNENCGGEYLLSQTTCGSDEITYSEGDFLDDIRSYYYQRDDCDKPDIFKTYLTITIVPENNKSEYSVRLIDDLTGKEIKRAYRAFDILCFDRNTKQVYLQGMDYDSSELLSGVKTIQFELGNINDVELNQNFKLYRPKLIVSGGIKYDVRLFLQQSGNLYGYELLYNKSSFYQLYECID